MHFLTENSLIRIILSNSTVFINFKIGDTTFPFITYKKKSHFDSSSQFKWPYLLPMLVPLNRKLHVPMILPNGFLITSFEVRYPFLIPFLTLHDL